MHARMRLSATRLWALPRQWCAPVSVLTHPTAPRTRTLSFCAAAMEPPVVLHTYTKDASDEAELQRSINTGDWPSTLAFHAGQHPPSQASAQQPPNEPVAVQQQSFDGTLYMAHLTSSGMGRVLLATEEITSTQDFLKAHHTRLPAGTVLTAERQVSGKGRGGNQWTSPAGCLMFTVSRPLAILGEQAPFINYVVCLGLLRGIRDAVGRTCPGLDLSSVRIKWPNDIYYVPQPTNTTPPDSSSHQQPASQQPALTASNSSPTTSGLVPGALKIGGVLINTTWSAGKFNLLVGVGLNVSNRQPTTCLDALVEEAVVRQAGKCEGDAPRVRRELLLARVISHLDECFQVFEQQSFAPLESDYLDSWLHSGQRVWFKQDAEQSVDAVVNSNSRAGQQHQAASEQPVAAGSAAGSQQAGNRGVDSESQQEGSLAALRIQGLSKSGFLLAVEEGTGREYELTPDGNSLDMLAGLIRKKLTV